MTDKHTPILDRLRNSLEYRTGVRIKRRHYPSDAQELAASELFKQWWYYSVELLPGLSTEGIYQPELPMLPRMMLRRCDLRGMSCLDMGSMEGLIPVLMKRGGASEVLAVDAVAHCQEKLEAVQHYYDAQFEFKSVGLMYDLQRKLAGSGFDLVNCSGLLYHVFSPLMVLCGVRPLVKRGGLMIVSTNVTLIDGFQMEFNDAGRLQAEPNTFWYLSVKLFDYLLRYLRLAPLECLFVPHEAVRAGRGYVFDKPSGYLSVVCRAVDVPLATPEDEWMRESARTSWEYLWLPDWELAARQPASSIRTKQEPDRRHFRRDLDCLDLWEAVGAQETFKTVTDPADSHLLRLSDRT